MALKCDRFPNTAPASPFLKTCRQVPLLPGMKKIFLPPPPDLGGITKDDYKNSPLMHYSLAKEKQKEVQKLV
jgi:hypothetical protein